MKIIRFLAIIATMLSLSLIFATVVSSKTVSTYIIQAKSSLEGIPIYKSRIIKTYPHDSLAFTQGLVYDRGHLYEGTGLNGKSSLRKVELETGKVLQKYQLPSQFFGEGIAIWKSKIIQLTWKSKTGFIYSKNSFQQLGTFSYPTEGWGLTQDGEHLIMSDGSNTLFFLNPETFAEVKRVQVHLGDKPIKHINELEYINGEIFANIWHTDLIARISPKTGQVLGLISLAEIIPPVAQTEAVPNGIAYDAEGKRLFVTGKLWPKLFEIEIYPVPGMKVPQIL